MSNFRGIGLETRSSNRFSLFFLILTSEKKPKKKKKEMNDIEREISNTNIRKI